MGFSLSGSHVIFFVASVIVASIVSGVFVAITLDVSTSLTERGDRLQTQLDTDFTLINDPENIPSSGNYYLFYIKNIGGNKLTTTNETFQIFVDGEIIAQANYYFTASSLQPTEYTTIYIAKSTIAAGSHDLRLVGPQAVEDEFNFEI